MQHLQQVFLPKSTGKNNYLVVLSMYIFITWYKLVVLVYVPIITFSGKVYTVSAL